MRVQFNNYLVSGEYKGYIEIEIETSLGKTKRFQIPITWTDLDGYNLPMIRVKRNKDHLPYLVAQQKEILDTSTISILNYIKTLYQSGKEKFDIWPMWYINDMRGYNALIPVRSDMKGVPNGIPWEGRVTIDLAKSTSGEFFHEDENLNKIKQMLLLNQINRRSEDKRDFILTIRDYTSNDPEVSWNHPSTGTYSILGADGWFKGFDELYSKGVKLEKDSYSLYSLPGSGVLDISLSSIQNTFWTTGFSASIWLPTMEGYDEDHKYDFLYIYDWTDTL